MSSTGPKSALGCLGLDVRVDLALKKEIRRRGARSQLKRPWEAASLDKFVEPLDAAGDAFQRPELRLRKEPHWGRSDFAVKAMGIIWESIVGHHARLIYFASCEVKGARLCPDK